MARSNFVGNDEDTLPLKDGDYIVVKRELNVEEERNILAKMVKTAIAGEKLELDPKQLGVTKVLEYIIEWGGPGFMDKSGRLVPFSATTLNNLRGSKFKEITDAIEAHEVAQEAAREALKNADGAISSSPISPSVEPIPAGR